MTDLWPRISGPLAKATFEKLGNPGVPGLAELARLEHPNETYAATGGTRASKAVIKTLVTDLREVATEYGYPNRTKDDADRINFDRMAAEVLHVGMNLTCVEASNRGVWNFLGLVAIPDLVDWRFGRKNLERWVASDLTRHMFSRLWWQALTFAEVDANGRKSFETLRRLSESDLNQIMERRSVAGNARLAQVLARIVTSGSGTHREQIRNVTRALRRRLAFVDFSVLTDEQIEDQIRSLM